MDANMDPLVLLRNEHEEIRTFLNKFEEYLKKISSNIPDEEKNNLISGLKELALYFDKDLEQHLKREEGALFPVLGNYIGIETGPINVMIIEHNHCRDLSGGFKTKINNFYADNDYKGLANAGISLSRLLSEHEDKEDHILFNMAEMHLSKNEKKDIAEKILTINI